MAESAYFYSVQFFQGNIFISDSRGDLVLRVGNLQNEGDFSKQLAFGFTGFGPPVFDPNAVRILSGFAHVLEENISGFLALDFFQVHTDQIGVEGVGRVHPFVTMQSPYLIVFPNKLALGIVEGLQRFVAQVFQYRGGFQNFFINFLVCGFFLSKSGETDRTSAAASNVQRVIKFFNVEPIPKKFFGPISLSGSNSNPQNTSVILRFGFFTLLDLEPNILFWDDL